MYHLLVLSNDILQQNDIFRDQLKFKTHYALFV